MDGYISRITCDEIGLCSLILGGGRITKEINPEYGFTYEYAYKLNTNDINTVKQTSTAGAVTTYTYKPLVGVTSKTDPHGETIYYEYDSAGRLSKIKDKNNQIIEEYNYHYKP